MERENGFLVMDDYKRLLDRSNGRNFYGWFETDEGIFLFKTGRILSCYKEIIYSKLALQVGVPTVGYDLAIHKGSKGVITKKCTKNKPITLKQILSNFLEEDLTYYQKLVWDKQLGTYDDCYALFDVESISRVLNHVYKDHPNYIEEQIEQNLFIRFIFQILFANNDLGAENLELEEDNLQFLPLYDFENCDCVHYESFKGGYNFFLLKRFNTYDIKEHPNITLKTFLERADRKEVETFKMYLEKLQAVSLNRLFKSIEEETGAKMPEECQQLKRKITQNFLEIHKRCKAKY